MAFKGKQAKEDEQYVPTLCQKCTSGRQAQIEWPDSGWVCWECYDELKPMSPMEAELEKRMHEHPEWTRGDEPRSQYRAKMMGIWRQLGGLRRMPT